MADVVAAGLGTSFQRSTDGGTTYTAVANVSLITPPDTKAKLVSYDILDGDGYTRYLAATTDPGKPTLTLYFDPASVDHEAMYADSLHPQPTRNYKVLFADGKAITFAAIIEEFKVNEIKPDAMIEAVVSFQVIGAPTLG